MQNHVCHGWKVNGIFATMQIQYFNPFENINLDPNICFITGANLCGTEESISVFPDWILNRFELRDKKFKMMDQFTNVMYGELRLPCSQGVIEAFQELESEIQTAFKSGYHAVKEIPSERLFIWMGKIVYGILYHDIINEKARLKKQNKEFGLSPKLKERYSLFHLMLQSLVSPIAFKGQTPWSLSVVRVKYSKDVFNFRDNPITLDFSLGLNGFGIVACLQDAGLVTHKLQPLLDKIGENELHPVQFEELCARFLYTNYLFKHNLRYKFENNENGLIIEPLPVEMENSTAPFSAWDDTMYAQVLAGYLQPWGYTTKNIVKFPDGPISFLENEYDQKIISPDKIDLPY